MANILAIEKVIYAVNASTSVVRFLFCSSSVLASFFFLFGAHCVSFFAIGLHLATDGPPYFPSILVCAPFKFSCFVSVFVQIGRAEAATFIKMENNLQQ